ncbi:MULTISPECIES: hypothetical protein [Pseudomonas]|uniref:defense against restriction DarA-related protein n=1 Tax=Pseudomonas TaxID=286 RepID=UPI000761145A|nr:MULTISPECIES: hypothetical protein [Pseudomonas]MDG9809431.1 hypothetical protein [Pseudomonas juntendi]MDG9815787.1 hypothetical protein [Pseudomonas putida]
MPATNPLDFSSSASAATALKKVKQLMIRAGQAVAGAEFVDKPRRTNGITYREAVLTLASGQLVTLRVTASGDIYQVLLNSSVVPIKAHNDTAAAVAEIAAMAEKNQAAFQKAQARKAIALPPGMTTPKPKMAAVLTERVAQLDTQIAERRATVADLKQQLGSMTDSTGGASRAPELGEWERDVLRALGKTGYLEDGQVSSKAARDVLYELGYIDRYVGKDENQRDNVLTDKGREALAMLDSVPVQSQPVGHEPMLLAAAYIAAREIVAGKQELLDSAATADAVAQLRIALDVVETNHPINEAAGNLEQAKLEKRCAESFRLAISMLDSASPALTEPGLVQLVAIAAESAAEDGDIKDQEALAELLGLGLVEATDGLYIVTAKGNSALEDAGYDIYGEPFAAAD